MVSPGGLVSGAVRVMTLAGTDVQRPAGWIYEGASLPQS